MKAIDLTGKVFCRLTAIKRLPSKNKKTIWLCKCSCGKYKSVGYHNLTASINPTKSCGCLQREHLSNGRARRLPPGEAAVNQVFRQYKNSAKDRALMFEIDLKTFKNIIFLNCHYCGSSPNHKVETPGGSILCNGIDRSINSIGYIKNNCRPCCWRCNRMKGGMDEKEFLSIISLIDRNTRSR